MNSNNKLFKTNIVSDSELYSDNPISGQGNLFPSETELFTGKTSSNQENSNTRHTDSVSPGPSIREDKSIPDYQNFILKQFRHFRTNDEKESKSSEQDLFSRIFDIFYRLLDDDARSNFIRELDLPVASFLLKHITELDKSFLYETISNIDIDALKNKVQSIVNIQRINDIRNINKFFESVNNNLVDEGIFIGCVETLEQRKKRISTKFPSILTYPYFAVDFIFKRAFPKIYFTKKLYFSITKGRSRLLSLAETLGRLVSCGFEILGYEEINNKIYFAAKRVREPFYDKAPSYGFIIRLKRIGKNGKIFNVYKIRTMHPYAEYLQEYIYDNNNLKEGGKFKNDFRITPWGRIFRKYRLDEIPMLWNFLKGDVKLFGVRPLSSQYYSLYDEDSRKRRIEYKPGLVPPFFADLPKTFKEIVDSERRYLDNFDVRPFRTDWEYFWKVMYNIGVRHVMGE